MTTVITSSHRPPAGGMPLPAPQPRRRMAAEHSRYAARHAKIAPSKTAAAFAPTAAVAIAAVCSTDQRITRATPPGRQIPIDGNPHAAHRGFLPWRLSDAGPQCRLIDRQWAGIRNPSPEQP